jgi:Tfp pilus assembly protein PilV
MISRWKVVIVSVSVLALAGLAQAKPAKTKKATGTPIDGIWTAKGTVTVAKHISDAKVGDKTTRRWTIKSSCAAACKTSLSYQTSSGHRITAPLQGKGANWHGRVDNVSSPCTNGGTATGPLTFKLHVTGFTKKKKHKVATGISAIGTQSGTGCATVKLVVKFVLARA